jgi:hypothetical protein
MPTPMTPRRDLEAQLAKLDAELTATKLALEQAERERRRWFNEVQGLNARLAQQHHT